MSTEQDEEGGIVIEFNPRTAEPVITNGNHPARKPWCGHYHASVDRSARKVWCRDCGIDLDPIDTLVQVARKGDMYLRMRDETRALTAKLEELQRQVKNAKAQRKRATRSDS